MSAVAQPLDAPATRSMADALRMLAVDAVVRVARFEARRVADRAR
ncbi:hypothetical protein OKW40_006833 [Paraburkholderia sp. RAU6.4a]